MALGLGPLLAEECGFLSRVPANHVYPANNARWFDNPQVPVNWPLNAGLTTPLRLEPSAVKGCGAGPSVPTDCAGEGKKRDCITSTHRSESPTPTDDACVAPTRFVRFAERFQLAIV